MPSDFEDEEIDEDLAFTEEDKKKYAGWFDKDDDEGDDEAAEEDGEGGSSDLDMQLLDSDEELGQVRRARSLCMLCACLLNVVWLPHARTAAAVAPHACMQSPLACLQHASAKC